jgi:hypothetical protein
MQIETFQNNLSATNFRKLIEHLISENEKVLKSTAYQVPVLGAKEEEKKHESSRSSKSGESSSDLSDQES